MDTPSTLRSEQFHSGAQVCRLPGSSSEVSPRLTPGRRRGPPIHQTSEPSRSRTLISSGVGPECAAPLGRRVGPLGVAGSRFVAPLAGCASVEDSHSLWCGRIVLS